MNDSGVRHLRNHVVVGADGSASATRAVEWAAHEASRRRMPLRVVHGYVWQAVPAPFSPTVSLETADGLHEAARQILAAADATARDAEPGIPVQTHLAETSGAVALLRAADDAALVVVGSRGHGGFAELLLGSTAVQLAMYAPCPVVVVRGAEPGDGNRPIVVGVDASDHAIAALGFGFEAASLRGVPLHAVHTWVEPVPTEHADMLPLIYDPQEVQDNETRLLAELLAGWSAKYPDVTVTREVVRGRAQDALLEASHTAQLLVVGARGVGGFRGLLFGSVSQAMVHHAHCPVAVVRAQH